MTRTDISLAPNIDVSINERFSYTKDSGEHVFKYRVVVYYYMTVNFEEHDMGLAVLNVDSDGKVEEIVENYMEVDDFMVINWAERAMKIYKEKH